MERLTEIIKRLHSGKVEFVLIGGLAAIRHGASYGTFDVDICVPPDPANFKMIASAVRDLNPRFRQRKDLPFELTPELLSTLKNLYLFTDNGPLDCLTEVAGVGSYSVVLEQSEPTGFPFGQIRVLKIDTLIRAKEAMGRPQDLLVTTQLRAIRERISKNQSQS